MSDATVDEQGRREPPHDGDEFATLTGFLDFQRATFAWKCSGLDDAALARTIPPTTMTLGGMMKHLALVEDDWFQKWLLGAEWPEPWRSVDWSADRDWDWHSAADDDAESIRRLWSDAVARSDAAVRVAMDDGGLGRAADREFPDGRRTSLRWILTHMIEEYARHNGHADLLRESIDGATGE